MLESVVLLYDDTLKWCGWKIRNIAELMISNDKSARAAKVDVISNDKIKRPVKSTKKTNY